MKRSLPLIAAFVAILSLAACGGSSQNDAPSGETPAALSKVDISIGTGAEAVAPKTVKVHYTGWLYSSTATGNKGTQFETSVGTNQPFSLKLGVNGSIAGFEQGVLGMKVGGKRTVIIPASLAYGANGNPPKIPRNSGLVFELELMEAL